MLNFEMEVLAHPVPQQVQSQVIWYQYRQGYQTGQELLSGYANDYDKAGYDQHERKKVCQQNGLCAEGLFHSDRYFVTRFKVSGRIGIHFNNFICKVCNSARAFHMAGSAG